MKSTDCVIPAAKRFFRKAADILYPARCPVCEKLIPLGKYICDECNSTFEYKNCETNVSGFPLYYVCEYNSVSQKIVLGAKNDWDGDKLDFMAKAVCDMLDQYGLRDNFDAVIPVPISKKSRMERGYNQTEKIAGKISELSGLKVIKAVKKIKNTAQQKQLGRSDRLKNLNGAFAVNEYCDIKGKTVLLLDDVCTTGATFTQTAKVLMNAGCAGVVCVCFARAVLSFEDGDSKDKEYADTECR